jgi:hypothetical protein
MIANAKYIRMSVEFIDHKGLKQEVPENSRKIHPCTDCRLEVEAGTYNEQLTWRSETVF